MNRRLQRRGSGRTVPGCCDRRPIEFQQLRSDATRNCCLATNGGLLETPDMIKASYASVLSRTSKSPTSSLPGSNSSNVRHSSEYLHSPYDPVPQSSQRMTVVRRGTNTNGGQLERIGSHSGSRKCAASTNNFRYQQKIIQGPSSEPSQRFLTFESSDFNRRQRSVPQRSRGKPRLASNAQRLPHSCTKTEATSTPVVGKGKKSRTRIRKSKSMVSSRDSSVSSNSRSSAPITISIADMISHQDVYRPCEKKTPLKRINEDKVEKIGKVREVPKVKRPSRLKRTLLAERMVIDHTRCSSAPGLMRSSDQVVPESFSRPSSDEHDHDVSQLVTEVTKLSVGYVDNVVDRMDATPSIPKASSLPVNNEQDELVSQLMHQLAQFQDRAYVKYAHTPGRRKRTKRFVCGLREVVKHLKLHNLRMIFLARDLERGASNYCSVLQGLSRNCVTSSLLAQPNAASAGDSTTSSPALEDIIQKIWDLATNPGDDFRFTPILITHVRRTLAQLCNKPGRVSIIGVLSVAGGEEIAQRLLALGSAINMTPLREDVSSQDSVEAVDGNNNCTNPVNKGLSIIEAANKDPTVTDALLSDWGSLLLTALTESFSNSGTPLRASKKVRGSS